MEQGEAPDAFASASAKHTRALAREGILKSRHGLAENSMRLLAAPGITIRRNRMLDILLDPALRLGASTPRADPAGG